MNFPHSQKYFKKALKHFQKIDHFRGAFVTLKDLHTVGDNIKFRRPDSFNPHEN